MTISPTLRDKIVAALSRPTMSKRQYKEAIAALGLSQERAGDWLGISPRTSQGYAIGERPVPIPTVMLLRLLIELGITADDVE